MGQLWPGTLHVDRGTKNLSGYNILYIGGKGICFPLCELLLRGSRKSWPTWISMQVSAALSPLPRDQRFAHARIWAKYGSQRTWHARGSSNLHIYLELSRLLCRNHQKLQVLSSPALPRKPFLILCPGDKLLEELWAQSSQT